MSIRYASSGLTIRGPQPDEWGLRVSTQENPALSDPGSTSESTENDMVFTQHTAASYIKNHRILIDELRGAASPLFEALDQSIATVDALGNTTRVSTGTARFRIRSQWAEKEVSLAHSIQSGASTTVFARFIAGTLGLHCSDAIDDRIAGKTLTANGSIFSSQNHTAGVYVRNPDLWCGDLAAELTCISPWNSSTGALFGVTLLSPQHIGFSVHAQPSVGAQIRFVAADNTVVTRTLVAKKDHPNYVPYTNDVAVGVLDSAVPASIVPCKVAPSDIADYVTRLSEIFEGFAGIPYGGGVPCLCLDQEEKALVTDLSFIHATRKYARFLLPPSAGRAEFYEDRVMLDSSNPAFLIINDELALVTTWTYGGAGSGPYYGAYIADLNTMIGQVDTLAGVSTGHTVTEADPSEFTNYA